MHKTTLKSLIAVTLALIFLISSAHTLQASENELYTIHFSADLSDAQLSALKEAGVALLDKRGRNEFIVKADNAGLVASFPFVESIRSADIGEKLSPSLRMAGAAPSASDVEFELTISLYDKKAFSAVRDAVLANGGTMKSRRLLFGRRMVARLPLRALFEIAGMADVRAVEPGPRAKTLHNTRAAKLSHIDSLQTDFGLTGSGIRGGIWDGGAVYDHNDHDGRVIIAEKGKVSDHATHVAGTIVSSGTGNARSAGMAPDAFLYSFNFDGDLPTEMFNAVKQHKISFSNNSWTYSNGWSYHYLLKLWLWWGDENFGRYSAESAAYDELINKTNLVILFAAGNDRTEKGTTTEKYLDMTISRGNDEYHAQDGPYMTIDITGSAKNVITVGAVTKSGKMTSFSSWGPTRDGRVKPEIVAVGQDVFSTLPDDTYGSYSGTSMATPTASGGVALLQQQIKELTGKMPSVAVIRALLAASAKDLGRKGPDYQHGFGLFDALCAAKLVEDSLSKGLLFEDTVQRAKDKRTRYYSVRVSKGTKNVKFALAWNDPAARPGAKNTLVNDLDIKVYAPNGDTVHLPWVLDGDKPNRAATTGENRVDNIELVEIDSPDSGEYIVEITGDSFGKGNVQKFALVVNSSEPIAGIVKQVSNR